MTILFAANEIDAFTTVAGLTDITADTTAGHYDSDFAVNGAIQLVNAGNLKAGFTGQTSGWFHCQWAKEVDDNNQDFDIFLLNDNANSVPVLWIDMDNGDLKFMYRNGTGSTQIGALYAVLPDQLYQIDIFWNIHASTGSFELYIDGAKVRELTGDTTVGTSVVSVDQIEIRALIPTLTSTAAENLVSEIIVATTSTLTLRVATISPSAAGTTSGWTGAYTDVDDLVTSDDTNFLSSGTANQVSTFAATNLSGAAAAMNVEAVVSCARARNAVTGPQNLQHVTRVAATDYNSASVSGISTAFQGFIDIQAVSPATAIAWTTAEVDALEIGVESKA